MIHPLQHTPSSITQLSNFIALDGDLCASLKMQFDIGPQTWSVEGQLLFRFEEQIIDHVTVFAALIRCLEPTLQTSAQH